LNANTEFAGKASAGSGIPKLAYTRNVSSNASYDVASNICEALPGGGGFVLTARVGECAHGVAAQVGIESKT
jgi:hypothetical protein